MLALDNGCKYHPEFRLQYFCLNDNCMEKLCDICIIEAHQQHKVQGLHRLSVSLHSWNRKRQAEASFWAAELKTVLGELESIERRVAAKYKRLRVEEKRLEEDFERRSRKWLGILQERNGKLQKKIEKLKAKVSSTKGIINVSEEVVNLAESTNEDIRKLLKKQEVEVKGFSNAELKSELTQLSEEANSFDSLSLQSIQTEVFLNSNGAIQLNNTTNRKSNMSSNRPSRLSPVLKNLRSSYQDKSGLKIAIPETPAESQLVSKSRNETLNVSTTIPRTCKEPKDKRSELEDYITQIALKKQELKQLEKIREKLINTNKEIQQQIVRQNQTMMTNIDLLAPTTARNALCSFSPSRFSPSPQTYTTLRNGMLSIKSFKNPTSSKKDAGKEKLKTLINKLNQTCEEWSSIPTPESSTERKEEVRKSSLEPVDRSVKKKTMMKIVNLETMVNTLKKELATSRLLLNTTKTGYDKEREKAKEFEVQRDKIMNELKVLKENYKKFKALS